MKLSAKLYSFVMGNLLKTYRQMISWKMNKATCSAVLTLNALTSTDLLKYLIE